MVENVIVRTAEFALDILGKYISEGDRVLDGTMGNGFDTLKLADAVGIRKGKGQVYSFDIQQIALENTAELLKKHNMNYYVVKDQHRSIEKIVPKTEGNIYLYLDTHADIDRYIDGEIAGAIFNLGYLPGAAREITTQPDTTLIAVKKAAALLKQNGIIVIVIYPGHHTGKAEKIMVLDYMRQLDPSVFHAEIIETVNQPEDAPCIALITRKK